MNQDNVNDAMGHRTKVIKNPRLTLVKDKFLLAGVVAVCILIGLSSFLPKHKNKAVIAQDEKQDIRAALTQNMELIANIQSQPHTGYHGGNPNHPPHLRTAHDSALSKETLARMNAPSTFFSAGVEEGHAEVAKNVRGQTLTGHDTNSNFLNQPK